jgi:phosphopantothenoylcysteine decarboxylase/phosphopantothenate--cysteine ligase
MAEPETIVERIMALLEGRGDLAGLHVLVTAGPTREPLDPVRFLTNRSSGKMGYAVAEAARIRGAKVALVSGPVSLTPPKGVEIVPVETAREMFDAVISRFDACDIAVKAAAPADYRPSRYEDLKIKKSDQARTLELSPNPDIAAELGRRKKNQVMVIFAAETGDPVESAREKLTNKNADLVVANDVTAPGAGFDVDTNAVTLIGREGEPECLPLLTKREAADRILDAALAIYREKHPQGRR